MTNLNLSEHRILVVDPARWQLTGMGVEDMGQTECQLAQGQAVGLGGTAVSAGAEIPDGQENGFAEVLGREGAGLKGQVASRIPDADPVLGRGIELTEHRFREVAAAIDAHQGVSLTGDRPGAVDVLKEGQGPDQHGRDVLDQGIGLRRVQQSQHVGHPVRTGADPPADQAGRRAAPTKRAPGFGGSERAGHGGTLCVVIIDGNANNPPGPSPLIKLDRMYGF